MTPSGNNVALSLKTCESGLHQYDAKLRRCPECVVIRQRAWGIKYKDRNLQKRRERQKKNREKLNRQAREWRLKHHDEVLFSKAKLRREYPESQVLENIIQRCLNPKNHHYADYGGRGITVCKRWRGKGGLRNFIEDMGRRPSPELTIERVDNDLGYCKENCIWDICFNQMRNTRRNRWITYSGETLCLKDWAIRYRIGSQVLTSRLSLGWPIGRALTQPVKKCRK